MIAPSPALALALVLVAAPSLLPPPPARLLPPWYSGVDCYVPAPDVFAMQRASGNFDAYSAYGGAANDLACWRLNQLLSRQNRAR